MRQLLTTLALLTIIPVLHAQVPGYVPTNGLVGWWPFNGNANDESGNGNHGSVTGCAPADDRFGNGNSAYSFNGSEYITINNSLLPASPTSFTISAWFSTDTDDGRIISDRGSDINYFKYMVGIADSVVVAGNYSSGCNSGPQAINSMFQADEWNHVVDIKNFGDGTHKLYLNGALVAEETLLCYHASTNGTSIGRWVGITTDSYYEGLIDDIGVWNRALTPVEVQGLFNAGQPAPCISPDPVSFTGLNSSYTTSDAPVTLSGTPSGGVFIGPGVTGNTFAPSVAGEGTHSISYTYLDGNNCVNTFSLCTSVALGMGVEPGGNALGGVRVFPNPNRGQFTVELELNGLVSMQVFDARGALVHNEVFTASGARTQRSLDLSTLAKGSYTLQVQNNGGRISQTVVVE